MEVEFTICLVFETCSSNWPFHSTSSTCFTERNHQLFAALVERTGPSTNHMLPEQSHGLEFFHTPTVTMAERCL